MVKRKSDDPLGPRDWCRAALIALGEGGERAMAVEPLARRLGVTKGSFYWHFESRAQLLERALQMWRDEGTAQVIAELAPLSPRERLRALFSQALRDPEELRAEAALQAAAARGHPVIGPVVAEVNAARLAYVAAQYDALDCDSGWADAAYAAYLGACQLAAMQPSPITEDRRRALIATLQERFVP